jgi:two-component system, OmpR family, flagellar system response regulator FtcR
MYIIIDDRETVTESFSSSFEREGIACAGFWFQDFLDWLKVAVKGDLLAVDAFLLGDCEGRTALPGIIRKQCGAPIIALRSLKSLQQTIELFEAGVDDVVNVPVHIREILVRTAAIRRRAVGDAFRPTSASAIQVFFDGRDPQIEGEALVLPRRELRILEYMVMHRGRWVLKTQLFNAIYGIFDTSFDESVIESHISKLRKKLRSRLGFDPILSKRFVGYRLDCPVRTTVSPPEAVQDFACRLPTRHSHDEHLPLLIAP